MGSQRSHLLRRAAPVLCAGTVLLLSTSAIADIGSAERAAARALFDQGRELMAAGNIAEACSKFEESTKLGEFGGTLLNLADCYEKQGRLATAWSTFLSAAAVSKNNGNVDRESEARRRAAALEPQLPKLVIVVRAPTDSSGLEIQRDGAAVGAGQWGVEIPVDPGAHRISASAPGHAPWETVVELLQGQQLTIEIPPLTASNATRTAPAISMLPPTVKPTAPRPSPLGTHSTRTALAVASGVVGIAGIATGSIFGLASMSKHSKADALCDGGACRDAEGVKLRDDSRVLGNLSTAAFIIGAAGVAGGVTLWLTTPKNGSGASGMQLSVAPGAITIGTLW